MIIGGNKDAVIENIKIAATKGRFNDKVEINDPTLSSKEKSKLIKHYLSNYQTIGYRFCNWMARCIVDQATRVLNRKTKVIGLENIEGITSGAIVTSNHFNPIDNTIVRKAVKKAGYKRLYIVSQETNLAMTGVIGFLMNHADIIPLINNKVYLDNYFPKMLKEKLDKKQLILIYPEQEMWFNYRKPRPLKRGAYLYAVECNVPVISCFVEIENSLEPDTEGFNKTLFTIHILKPIYPDQSLSQREASKKMMETDYEQKKQAYEDAYGKKLDYTFEKSDIAGWIPKQTT